MLKKYITVFFNILLLQTSFAQVPLSECEKEIQDYCSGDNKRAAKLSCLLENEPVLSKGCKQQLQRVTEAMKDTGVRGGGGLSSFGGVMGGFGLVPPKKTVITANVLSAPEGRPTVVEQSKLNIATPIYSKNGDSFSMSLGVGSLNFNEKQTFDDATLTPRELRRLEIGGQYGKFMKDSKMFGVRASVGSASDKPFYSKDEVTYSLNSFYSYPTSPKAHWVWTVFVSNNNPILNYIPIPGFIYLYKHEGFTGMFGLPFLSMQWTPKEPWVLSMSFFITNFNSEMAYGYRDKVQGFMGFSVNQQSFLRKEREEKEQRLYFSEKRIFAGVRSPLSKSVSGEFQTGLSFDRSLREGRRFNDAEMEAEFGRSWYASANLILLI